MAQAYDQHLNMILGDVEETITTVEIDDETYEEIIKVRPAWLLCCIKGKLGATLALSTKGMSLMLAIGDVLWYNAIVSAESTLVLTPCAFSAVCRRTSALCHTCSCVATESS